MKKALIVTEKPSVAKTLARVLGARERKDGYLVGNGMVVSWCVGHLVELARAEAYDARYAVWKREDLPILPNPWKTTVSERTRKQFDVLSRLMNDPDIETVVCATDAGREGELIFRLVYEACRCKKPVKRLWISSLEESAIRDGFAHLREGCDYERLYQAALCRARADWLVGINLTRLLSILYGRTLNVGRVMSPTLAMIAERERQIEEFRPETFYTVTLRDADAQSERMKDREKAIKVAAACQGQTAIVQKIERQEKMQNPPKLYDLTTLQREANRLFGFTAQQTLDYAQELYEKRLISYPRTDSRFLTAEMEPVLPELIKGVAAAFPFSRGLLLPINAARIVNDAKVTDHHALIPTRYMPTADLSELPEGEKKILSMIAVRLMCSVGDAHRYEEMKVTLDCGGHTFVAKGKSIGNMGWKIPEAVFRGSYRIRPDDEPENALPPFEEGMLIENMHAAVKESMTKAEPHYTEGTILLAMERAGAEDMPEEAERRGIGTPATRAGIIEKLIKGGFIERQGSQKAKALVPTPKGMALAAVLPERVKSAKMTAEWETMLGEVENGSIVPEHFMEAVTQFVAREIRNAKPVEHGAALFPPARPVIGVCPCCGGSVLETVKGYFCENRACRFSIWKDNRFFAGLGKPVTAETVAGLLNNGCIYLEGLRSKKTGKSYSATVVMESENGSPRFHLNFENNGHA